MIFFRERMVQIKIPNRNGRGFFIFANLRASFESEIDELSGMVVNLKDVDRWFDEITVLPLNFSKSQDLLKSVFAHFKKRTPKFRKLDLVFGDQTITFNGSEYLYTYSLHTWIQKDSTWVQRSIYLTSSQRISRKWRDNLSRKKWSRAEVLAQFLKTAQPGLALLQVRKRETQTAENFKF